MAAFNDVHKLCVHIASNDSMSSSKTARGEPLKQLN